MQANPPCATQAVTAVAWRRGHPGINACGGRGSYCAERAAELQQRQQRQEAAVAALNKSFELGFDMGRLPRDAKSGQLELRLVAGSGALRLPPQAPSRGGQDPGVGARRRRAICYVEPAKVEVAFQRSSLYVGKYGANPRGGDSLQDSQRRFRAALEFFASGQEVLVSSAVLEEPALRQIRFIDGKHRFCVYRDLGLQWLHPPTSAFPPAATI